MKNFICVLLLFLTGSVFSKDLYELSLEKVVLPTEINGFKIVEVIDGRADKSNIGWVQTGAFNKKKTAVFKNTLSEEIKNFMENSISMEDETQVLVRITRLYISEQTKAMSETSKAELALDFFLKEGENKYYFITKNYNTVESNGLDVTKHHPENIGNTIVKGLEQFSERDWRSLVNKTKIYTKSGLLEGVEAVPDISTIAILNTEKYMDGVFISFDEFLNNDPAFTADYKVKIGNKVKLWITKDNVKSRTKEGVYGFAHENKLYVLFHKGFYPLRKEKDGFYFTGPHIPNQSAVAAGALLGGAIGGAIASSASGGRSEYKIDLSSGSIVEIMGIKK